MHVVGVMTRLSGRWTGEKMTWGVRRRNGKMVVGMALNCGDGTSMDARLDYWLI